MIQDNYRGPFDVELTLHRGHATELSRNAVEAGYETVVAVGGDGTFNEVLNGLIGDPPGSCPDTALGLLPLGTGNDFVRTLGVPRQFDRAVRSLNRDETTLIDVGRVRASGPGGAPAVRYFMNVADVGSGGAVAAKLNSTTKVFGPQVSTMWAIVSTIVRFKNPTITFSIDDGVEERAVINDLVLANAMYFGGGLKPAPDARIDDGLLDVVTLGDFGFLESLMNLPRLKRGTHLTHPKVRSYRSKKIHARADEEVLVEVDGEVLGSLPATFEILPRALRIK